MNLLGFQCTSLPAFIFIVQTPSSTFASACICPRVDYLPNDFNNVVAQQDGVGQTTLSYTPLQSGDFYIRIGNGGNGAETGGYRIDVSTVAPPQPPPPPPPQTPPAEAVDQWIDARVFEILHFAFDAQEAKFEVSAILGQMSHAEAAATANQIATKWSALGYIVDWVEISAEMAQANDPVERLYVGIGDWLAGVAISLGGSALFGGLGLLAGGPLGVSIGLPIGAFAGSLVYSNYLSTHVEEYYDRLYDGMDDPEIGFTPIASLRTVSLTAIATAVTTETTDLTLEDAQVFRFYEVWYISNHADVAQAIANGSVGSAYAHFLTIGIDWDINQIHLNSYLTPTWLYRFLTMTPRR